jgi:protein-L-isoaspartate O-methyltransferase
MANAKITGTDGYGVRAEVLADQYESVTFEDVHHDILHLLPRFPCRALDVGAGSGRDAAALARLGHAVTAVEPTVELRQHGQRLHRRMDIRWIDDGLPDLSTLTGETFDLIMLTAVLMHLDGSERRAALGQLAKRLSPRGLLAMTLRHGPVPVGRRMFEVSGREVAEMLARDGLTLIHEGRYGDMLGRDAVTWTSLVFRNG